MDLRLFQTLLQTISQFSPRMINPKPTIPWNESIGRFNTIIFKYFYPFHALDQKMRESFLVVGILLLVLGTAAYFLNIEKIKVVDDEGKVRHFQVEVPLPIILTFGITGLLLTIFGVVIPGPNRRREKRSLDEAMKEASR